MPDPRGLRVVVMGVSGCGKTTVGRALAARLGLPYIEGDDLHPPHNVARMAAGVPLTDADREGWLQAVARELADAPGGAVVSCSALKRRYRELLRRAAPDLRLVHLHGPRELLAARLAGRQGHYMPASLLPSQFEALEPPVADEHAISIDVSAPPETILAEVLHQLQTTPA
jgi:gluconokinase